MVPGNMSVLWQKVAMDSSNNSIFFTNLGHFREMFCTTGKEAAKMNCSASSSFKAFSRECKF